MVIASFNTNGNLPAGIHTSTWKEFCERFGHNFYRRRLIDGMKSAFKSLKKAGCKTVYVDGSFVTSKHNPKDFDACWELEGVDPTLLDRELLDFKNGRAAQKVKYRGELFPSSIKDDRSGKTYLEFFQTSKESGELKGIVSLDLGEFE